MVRLDNNVLIGESSDRERRLPRFFATLLYGITLIPRLVISPFVDSIGKATWEDLVRRTRNTIRDPMDLQPDLQLVDPEKKERYLKDFEKYPFGTGLFARLFHELDICVNDMTKECGRGFLEKDMAKKVRKSLKASEITLIGHSMGTIVLNELLRVYPRLPYENIVYMAAASSMSDFYRSVIPLLEKDKEGDGKKRGLRFYSLLLHPYAEATERFAGGMAPDGSLLEWVDNMYERPKTIFDRTLGKWRNLKMAKWFFSERAQEKMLFRVFNLDSVEEDPPNPVKHGDFNNKEMRFWMPKFWGDDQVKWKEKPVDER